jgi:hypothetical protein
MSRSIRRVVALAALSLGIAVLLHGQSPEATACDAPAEDRSRYTAMPRGDLFCALLADPKAIRSFASYQRSSSRRFAIAVASVGIGDVVGLGRWNSSAPGDGVQIGADASVFAQFDLRSASFDLLNADYLVGIPITARRGPLSARLRFYHQSSHLGDEFLLRPATKPKRENLSFESADLLISVERGQLRAYAGAEYLAHRGPRSLAPVIVHGGAEFRQRRPLLRIGTVATIGLVAGIDAKATRDQAWSPAVSARIGFEFERPRDARSSGRRWSLLGEWYDGPAPYGQFYRDGLRYYGIGVHFTP